MNIFKHIQPNFWAASVLTVALFPVSFLANDSSYNFGAPSVNAQPVAVHSRKAPARKRPEKLLSKTFSTDANKKERPLYRANGELKNDLATRLTDPQRKESPIRTARLFKIQINE